MREFLPLVAFALLTAGCCLLPSGPGTLGLVPSDATAVSLLKPSAILTDGDLEMAYSAASGGSLGSRLATLLDGTGIDARTVPGATSFLIEQDGGATAYIVQGAPGLDAAETSLRANSSWLASQYSGQTLYQAAGGRSVAFIDGNLVAGDAAAVKGSMDVKAGTKQDVRQNPRIVAMINELDPNSPILTAADITPGMRSRLEASQGPLSAALFANLDSAGLEMKRSGGALQIRALLHAGSPDAAASVMSGVTIGLNLLNSMSDSGGALQSVTSKVQVSVAGQMIEISLLTNGEEMRGVKAELDRLGA